jgi:hypothetical protein
MSTDGQLPAGADPRSSNLIVLWNTIYMDAALNQLSAEGYEARPEDIARLSPLGHKHVNMLGE